MSKKPEELHYSMLREESGYIHCNNLLTKKMPVTDKRTKINPGNYTRKSCSKFITVDCKKSFST